MRESHVMFLRRASQMRSESACSGERFAAQALRKKVRYKESPWLRQGVLPMLNSVQLAHDSVRTQRATRLLIIDSNPVDRQRYLRFLQIDDKHEYMVVEAATAVEGARLLTEEFYDCVVMEYALPGVDGLTVLKSVHESADGALDSPVVMITGQGSEAIAVEAMKLGVSDYLTKSVMTAEAFERAVSRAIERSRLRMALREQNHHLQRVNAELHRKAAELERFYHTVSHELKTPLTAVREFIALLRDGIGGPPLSEQQRDFVAHALEGCDHIARQVNDLLDSARSDTDKLLLQPEWLEVGRTIEFAVASVQQSALAKELKLEVTVAPGLPRVIADHGKLAQVIGNLLSNAVKFTRRGGTVRIVAGPMRGSEDQVGCGARRLALASAGPVPVSGPPGRAALVPLVWRAARCPPSPVPPPLVRPPRRPSSAVGLPAPCCARRPRGDCGQRHRLWHRARARRSRLRAAVPGAGFGRSGHRQRARPRTVDRPRPGAPPRRRADGAERRRCRQHVPLQPARSAAHAGPGGYGGRGHGGVGCVPLARHSRGAH